MNRRNSSPALVFRPFQRNRPRIFGREIPWQDQILEIIRGEKILDPGGRIVTQWNHVFLVSCLIALSLDPLYFYLQWVAGPACLDIDLKLGITVTFFRTVGDFLYLINMFMKFRTAFVAPSSRVFGRGELVMDRRMIASRYLKSTFIIDLAATLPLPQTVIWFIMPATRDSINDHTNNTLAMIVLFQYVPRLFLIFPLNRRIIKNTGVVARTAWAGAAYNLLLYMLASHVLGASWYLLSIERQHNCWRFECLKETHLLLPCDARFLDCRHSEEKNRKSWLNMTQVHTNCDILNPNLQFQFGIYEDAFVKDVVASRFLDRFFYCLWWGLKNLSSYGQSLGSSTSVNETLFCILICIVGLVLFSQLIGNMQTYLASMTVRLEEWRVKRRDTEEWMKHRQLPLDLQERVRRFVQYKWLATRGVDEESILHSLPMDLRREIQRHLCLALVRRVPFFSQMDDQLLDAICEHLVSSLSTPDTYIVREGDPVNEMLFIIRGQLESSTTNGGRSGFFNSITLGPGDFCGEELLTWALMRNPSLNLPSSTRTVRALSEVEAFALCAEDLKFVANQFKRLHSKKLQHAFRYYSHQWRTWGACFIQAAWRRYKKRKLAKELMMHENYYDIPITNQEGDCADEALDLLYEDDDTERLSMENANTQHLGATILASRFAANTRRGVNQKFKVVEPSGPSLKIPKFLKPEEPDFSEE